jgi:enamine deaminase RidA (YjgF/YER057c/UK114 family)
MEKNNRRKMLTTAVAAVAATGVAKAQTGPTKKAHYFGEKPAKPPRFSSAVSYGNLLFLSGVGYHKEGDITVHTEGVLAEIKRQLENAGSSMEKVLKVNVYLNDLKDYDAMNKVYEGRWGDIPPVRTTVAPAGGIPGNSLVEIDCIAYI